jgi:hypothetical protein
MIVSIAHPFLDYASDEVARLNASLDIFNRLEEIKSKPNLQSQFLHNAPATTHCHAISLPGQLLSWFRLQTHLIYHIVLFSID